MNYINTWEAGCKVTIFDWIDGKSIYLHLEYFVPGQSLSKPAKEKSVLLEKSEETEYRLRNYLNSIVNHFMFK